VFDVAVDHSFRVGECLAQRFDQRDCFLFKEFGFDGEEGAAVEVVELYG
jgi:hypothetical protein